MLGTVAVGRDQRMAERRERIVATFGEAQLATVVELLTLLELAWHDCYGELTPSEELLDDILLLSGGEVTGLIRAAHLAVQDWRDVIVAADAFRR
jgi:hypothetical protein